MIEKEVVKKEEMHKNVISVYAVSSQGGLNREDQVTQTEVQTKRKLGIGLMYQRRVYEDIYLGLGGDSNRGVQVNVGYGF